MVYKFLQNLAVIKVDQLIPRETEPVCIIGSFHAKAKSPESLHISHITTFKREKHMKQILLKCVNFSMAVISQHISGNEVIRGTNNHNAYVLYCTISRQARNWGLVCS